MGPGFIGKLFSPGLAQVPPTSSLAMVEEKPSEVLATVTHICLSSDLLSEYMQDADRCHAGLLGEPQRSLLPTEFPYRAGHEQEDSGFVISDTIGASPSITTLEI